MNFEVQVWYLEGISDGDKKWARLLEEHEVIQVGDIYTAFGNRALSFIGLNIDHDHLCGHTVASKREDYPLPNNLFARLVEENYLETYEEELKYEITTEASTSNDK